MRYRFGAVGVALGTLAGGIVSVGLHLSYTMRYTQVAIPVGRVEFVVRGLARPFVCAIPLFALLFVCRGNPASYGFWPPLLVSLLTAILIWFVGLAHSDREIFGEAIRNWRLSRLVRA